MLCFAWSAILLIPRGNRLGNLVGMLGAGSAVLSGELLRGLMTLTNMRGYRIAAPVFATAALVAFIAVVVGIPGAGNEGISELHNLQYSWQRSQTIALHAVLFYCLAAVQATDVVLVMMGYMRQWRAISVSTQLTC